MDFTPQDFPPPTPASTVIVFRHATDGGAPELLMVQRAKEMRFAGGAAVFPGGRVDPEDYALAARLAPDDDPEVRAARIAGIRETLEETGLASGLAHAVSGDAVADARHMLHEQGALEPVLEKFGWTLHLEQLAPFAHWCPNFERAFDTRFFVTDIGTGNVQIAVDATENTRLFWASAAEALRLADNREISIIYPTRRNLERVAQFGRFAEVLEHARTTPVDKIVPTKVDREGEPWLMIPEGLGYPVTGQPIREVRRA